MKKYKKLLKKGKTPLVCVTWRDAEGYAGWNLLEDVVNDTLYKTVGYLFRIDEYIHLTDTVSEEGYGNVSKIPLGFAVEVRLIEL